MNRARDVAEALAGQKLQVLRHLLPGGKVRGHEYQVGNLRGDPGGSLKIHLNGKGCPWSDFATGETGGDLLDLWAAARCHGDTAVAMREAAAWLGLERTAGRSRTAPRPRASRGASRRGDATGNGPATGEPSADDWRYKGRQPVATFAYHDEQGRVLYHVGRYEDGRRKSNGKAAKEYVPLTWTGQRWEAKRPPDPVLYNLPEIATHPAEGWLVFVEGEKVVDAARDLFERDLWKLTFTTWMGGPGQLKNQDLAAAEGHNIIIAADADDEGAKAAMELAERLAPIAATVKVWLPPAEFRAVKKGWDLADELPGDWDADRLGYALQAAPTPEEIRLAELGIVSADALAGMALPEPKFILPGYITEGYNVIGGRPKMGKSWWVLGEAVGVAQGRSVMANAPVEVGDVLYLALEDTPRRLQGRLKAIQQGRPAPPRLDLVTRWRRLDQGGLDDLRLWLKAHPHARMVVIDTLERFRGKRDRNAGIYADDYAVGAAIKALADEFQVAILAVHHLRKGDSEDPLELFSGSTGLTGSADTLLVLKRERSRADATLFVTGRDLHDAEKALSFDKDTGRWTLIGEAEDFRRGEEQNAILRTLADADAPMTPAQVAEALGKKREAVRFLMHKMRKAGIVTADDKGRYSAVAAGG